MKDDWTSDELRFRDEVRAFLEGHLPDDIRESGKLRTSIYARPDHSRRWHQILFRKGWAAPAWPVEHGGCGWTPRQRYIFARECIAAGAPPISQTGIDLVAYPIMRYGSEAQKAFFLPRTLSGEIFWAQGYSEPEAGSDLASLQMPAVEDGDDYVCSGAKLWTSYAHAANWIFCLVRTSIEAKRQNGISFLLIDMRTPGIRVEPIFMLSGEHVQNRVHFDKVRVPKANVVGAVGQGWTVAKHLLEFERGGSAYGPDLQVQLARLRAALADGRDHPGARRLDDAPFVARLAEIQMRVDVLERLELRMMSPAAGAPAEGLGASAMKVLGTELGQEVANLVMHAAGVRGLAYQPHAVTPAGDIAPQMASDGGPVSGAPWQALAALRMMNACLPPIFSGSNEIQRNIMARAILGPE